MEQEIQNKVERFIELSGKFSKAPEKYSVDYVITGSGQLTFSSGINLDSVIKQVSAAEKIRAQAEREAKLCEEYDEYLELQKDLSQYFKTVNKLKQ